MHAKMSSMAQEASHDCFSTELSRRLQNVLDWQRVERSKPATEQHWWPFPDAAHNFEAERYNRRPSMGRYESSTASSVSGTASSLHRRKLSVQDVWQDSNLSLQSNLENSSPNIELPPPRERSVLEEQFEQQAKGATEHQRLKQKRPLSRLNRSKSNLRMAKLAKQMPREAATVYETFDNEVFGLRQLPQQPDRRSSLALELEPDEMLVEEEDIDDEEAEKRLATITWNSRTGTIVASKAGTPGEESVDRRDSGYDCANHRSQALERPLDSDMPLIHDQGCLNFDFGQRACVW